MAEMVCSCTSRFWYFIILIVLGFIWLIGYDLGRSSVLSKLSKFKKKMEGLSKTLWDHPQTFVGDKYKTSLGLDYVDRELEKIKE